MTFNFPKFSLKDGKISNFFIVPSNIQLSSQKSGIALRMAAGGSEDPVKNLSNILVPIQMPRIKQDTANWRMALEEAEQAIYPYRVVMQQMYIDVVNDPMVHACIDKRKNLTILRKWALVNEAAEVDDKWTGYLCKDWFRSFLNHVLDAQFYGYTLVSIGDIVDDELPKLSIMRRWNISPDREQVSSITYVPNGVNFLEGEVSNWHIWVKTPSDVGVSNCGYGLLYPVSLQAIILRNNIAYNTTYNELFGMPIRVLKTAVSNESEREQAEYALEQMGSAGAAVINPDDDLSFIEAKSGGGYKSYGDLEKRVETKISQLIFGHSDAISSIPGKLGSGQGNIKMGEESTPVQQALSEIQTKDGEFVIPYVNQLLEKLRFHGIMIPENLKFIFLNDDEEAVIERRENENLKQVADILVRFKNAGIELEQEWIEKRIGMKITKVEPMDLKVPIGDTKEEVKKEKKNEYGDARKHKTE